MAVHNHVYRSIPTLMVTQNNADVMRNGLFPVYRLAVDAKTRRVMVEQAENI